MVATAHENTTPVFSDIPAAAAMNQLLVLIQEIIAASGGTYDPERFQQPVIGFVSTLYTDAWVTGVEFSLSLLADWMSAVDPERWDVLKKEVPHLLETFKSQFEHADWKPGLL